MKPLNKPLLTLLLLMLMTACDIKKPSNTLDDSTWATIGTGQEKQAILKLIGTPPDYSERTVVLGMETERLTWQSHLPPRRYQADLVMGRLVAKRTDDKPILAD